MLGMLKTSPSGFDDGGSWTHNLVYGPVLFLISDVSTVLLIKQQQQQQTEDY